MACLMLLFMPLETIECNLWWNFSLIILDAWDNLALRLNQKGAVTYGMTFFG